MVLPLGLTIFILILGLRKKSRCSIKAAVLILFTFSLGVVSDSMWKLVEYPWKRIEESNASNVEAIVVLSSGRSLDPDEIKILRLMNADRFLAGIKLFEAGKAEKLIFTGGSDPLSPFNDPEGNLYLKAALQLGVPSEAILTTGPVFNTSEEALSVGNILSILHRYSSPKILLVTSAFHMKRAKRQFERQGLIVYPFPVDFKSSSHLRQQVFMNPLNWFPNSKNLNSSSVALRELLGRIIYRSW